MMTRIPETSETLISFIPMGYGLDKSCYPTVYRFALSDCSYEDIRSFLAKTPSTTDPLGTRNLRAFNGLTYAGSLHEERRRHHPRVSCPSHLRVVAYSLIRGIALTNGSGPLRQRSEISARGADAVQGQESRAGPGGRSSGIGGAFACSSRTRCARRIA